MTRSLVVSLLFLLALAEWARAGDCATCGPILNCCFEDGTPPNIPDWTSEGCVEVATATGGNRIAWLKETCSSGTTNAGGMSRIFQEFTIPDPLAPPQLLSFRYRFNSSTAHKNPNPGKVPPDAFTAHLLKNNGSAWVSAVGALEDPLTSKSKGLLYRDANGKQDYATEVSLSGPDPDGLTTVMIDVSALEGETVRLEFGLASGANDAVTDVLIDNITLGCPIGYCCGAAGNNVIDDDNPCTDDTCNGDGTVSHDPIGGPTYVACCESCSDGANANIVFMLDFTSSTSGDDWDKALDAIEAVLEYYESATTKPFIAVGRFSTDIKDGNNNALGAKIDVPLTQDYKSGAPGSVLTWVTTARAFDPTGGTPLFKGIDVAAAEAVTSRPGDAGAMRYVVLVTDGWTNRDVHDTTTSPWSFPEPDCYCHRCDGCEEAQAAAQTSRANAEALGVEIAACYYLGQDEDRCGRTINCSDYSQGCPDDPQCNCCDCDPDCRTGAVSGEHPDSIAAREWLRDFVASTPDLFFPNPDASGAGPLVCPFLKVARRIGCDDGDPTTIDECIDGRCVHTPVSGG